MTEQTNLNILMQWHQAKRKVEEVKPLIEEERRLRKLVQNTFFATPKEGVNKLVLPSGWNLKMRYDVKRSLVAGRLEDTLLALDKISDYPVRDMFTYTPTLVTSAYRLFTQMAEPEAIEIFNCAVELKPHVAELTITPPKG